MKVRGRIVVVVLPLVAAPLIFAGLISSLVSRNGITGIATQFLQFKAEQIVSYATGQWQLLEDNNLTDSAELVDAAIDAITQFSSSVVRTETELILAVRSDGTVDFAAGDAPDSDLTPGIPGQLALTGVDGWQRVEIAGVARVAHAMPFEALGWQILVTERESTFYAATNRIVFDLSLVLAISLVVSIILLVAFSGYLTRPLSQIITAMTDIIRTNDLSSRVDVEYADETGVLSQRFNMMIARLDNAYSSVKREALRAVIAQKKEQQTRNIFQKYVPADVIDEIFANPEAMLVGKNQVLSVLFSDVRSFTTISESMLPEEVVESLNRYFTLMVDSITNRGGIVDKYMGDAVMAFFGAPVRKPDDAIQSVQASLDMLDCLNEFNTWQEEHGRPPFRIGIGLNYGNVTVGNIGSDKKMDYTIIGDMVNLANRLEGLSKRYQHPLVISDSVKKQVEGELPVRFLDRVVVKGKTQFVEVYTAARSLSDRKRSAWATHNKAMSLFFNRDFDRAGDMFGEVLSLAPADVLARTMIERCIDLARNPPPQAWTGVTTMTEK